MCLSLCVYTDYSHTNDKSGLDSLDGKAPDLQAGGCGLDPCFG